MDERDRETNPVDRCPDRTAECKDSRPERAAGGRGGELSLLILASRLAGFGWFVASAIAGGALGGLWLDGRLDTRPVLTLIGLALGIAVAAGGVVRMLRAFGSNGAGR